MNLAPNPMTLRYSEHYSVAGFGVTLYGRIWVTPEGARQRVVDRSPIYSESCL